MLSVTKLPNLKVTIVAVYFFVAGIYVLLWPTLNIGLGFAGIMLVNTLHYLVVTGLVSLYQLTQIFDDNRFKFYQGCLLGSFLISIFYSFNFITDENDTLLVMAFALIASVTTTCFATYAGIITYENKIKPKVLFLVRLGWGNNKLRESQPGLPRAWKNGKEIPVELIIPK